MTLIHVRELEGLGGRAREASAEGVKHESDLDGQGREQLSRQGTAYRRHGIMRDHVELGLFDAVETGEGQ